jgi:hypothetical protein
MRGPAAPSAQSHKLWLSDIAVRFGQCVLAFCASMGAWQNLEVENPTPLTLSEVDFGLARPELRAFRIMSDKPTLSDMDMKRQARRI